MKNIETLGNQRFEKEDIIRNSHMLFEYGFDLIGLCECVEIERVFTFYSKGSEREVTDGEFEEMELERESLFESCEKITVRNDIVLNFLRGQKYFKGKVYAEFNKRITDFEITSECGYTGMYQFIEKNSGLDFEDELYDKGYDELYNKWNEYMHEKIRIIEEQPELIEKIEEYEHAIFDIENKFHDYFYKKLLEEYVISFNVDNDKFIGDIGALMWATKYALKVRNLYYDKDITEGAWYKDLTRCDGRDSYDDNNLTQYDYGKTIEYIAKLILVLDYIGVDGLKNMVESI